MHLLTGSCVWQVIDCKSRQLLQECSYDWVWGYPYVSMAALPAGRIAAGTFNSTDMFYLDMASSGSARAGLACQPRCAAKTTLLGADASEGCAACLGSTRASGITSRRACAKRVVPQASPKQQRGGEHRRQQHALQEPMLFVPSTATWKVFRPCFSVA